MKKAPVIACVFWMPVVSCSPIGGTVMPASSRWRDGDRSGMGRDFGDQADKAERRDRRARMAHRERRGRALKRWANPGHDIGWGHPAASSKFRSDVLPLIGQEFGKTLRPPRSPASAQGH